jgi:hypothetical protein
MEFYSKYTKKNINELWEENIKTGGTLLITPSRGEM